MGETILAFEDMHEAEINPATENNGQWFKQATSSEVNVWRPMHRYSQLVRQLERVFWTMPGLRLQRQKSHVFSFFCFTILETREAHPSG